MTTVCPTFLKKENEKYFIAESGNYRITSDAPKELVEEFELYQKQHNKITVVDIIKLFSNLFIISFLKLFVILKKKLGKPIDGLPPDGIKTIPD